MSLLKIMIQFRWPTHSTKYFTRTFEGPSLIFFICSRYFFSSSSSLAIFFSIDSPRLSTPEMASVRLGGGAFFLAPPNSRFILFYINFTDLSLNFSLYRNREMNWNQTRFALFPALQWDEVNGTLLFNSHLWPTCTHIDLEFQRRCQVYRRTYAYTRYRKTFYIGSLTASKALHLPKRSWLSRFCWLEF